MYFEELTIKEKVEVTLKEFKHRNNLAAKGRKEADQYRFINSCRIKHQLRGEKRASIK